MLKFGHTSKVFFPHCGTRVDGTPLSFRYVALFRKDFTFSRKPVMCSTRRGIHYGLQRCREPVTSSKVAAMLAAILNCTQIRNGQKTKEFKNF